MPTMRYAATSAALKLVTKDATRSSPNRSVAAVVSSISARLFGPLLIDTAETCVGSARNRFRAALMQYTPMSYSVPPPYWRFVRMSPRRTVIENEDVKNFKSPRSPRRARSMAERLTVSKCSRYAIMSLARACRQAAIICWHSRTVTAIGFSHKTCTLALAARTVYSACIEFGRAMYTASTSFRQSSNWS